MSFCRSFTDSLAGVIVIAMIGTIFFPLDVWGQETTIDSGDTAWMLTATVLVLMMTIPGLALFYGGMVRQMNVLSTVMQSFSICCLATILWMVAGYSIAFSEGTPYFGSLDNIMLQDLTLESVTGTIPESVFMVFQMTFAVITPALITGALVERMKFSTLLVFMGLWSLLVYAPICHWVWGGGFLQELGVLDFAGGTVVHINAGMVGLVAALVIGPRMGYRAKESNPNLTPHNLVYSLIGASLLWVGWFGFNAGSAIAANASAGMAMAVTQIASAAAAIGWMTVEWIVHKKPSVLGIITGAIGGLVAITPAAGFVDPFGALIIGSIAGVACFYGATTLKKKLGYDDSLDVFGVHGIGGIVGAFLTGVFAREAIGGTPGLIEGNAVQVIKQCVGIVVTMIYCGIISYALLKGLDRLMGLRVEETIEHEGLDFALHGENVH